MNIRDEKLLQLILNEGTDIKKSDVEDEIYRELDDFLYEDVRNRLRTVILESDLSDSEKVEKITKIEEAVITEDHVREYLKNHIEPILEITGLSRFNGSNPVFVSGPVLEAIFGLDLIKRGKFKTLKNLVNEHAIAFEDPDRLDPSTREEAIESFYANLFEHWGITETKEKKSIIAQAKKYLNESGIQNILWDPFEAALFMESSVVTEQASGAVGSATPAAAGNVGSATPTTSGTSGTSGTSSAGDGQKTPEAGILRQWWNSIIERIESLVPVETRHQVKSRVTQYLMNTSWSKAGGIALGVGLLGLIAGLIWRKRSQQCAGLKGGQYQACMRGAIDAAITGLRAQRANCSKTANPQRCQQNIDKVIASWQAKKSRL